MVGDAADQAAEIGPCGDALRAGGTRRQMRRHLGRLRSVELVIAVRVEQPLDLRADHWPPPTDVRDRVRREAGPGFAPAETSRCQSERRSPRRSPCTRAL